MELWSESVDEPPRIGTWRTFHPYKRHDPGGTQEGERWRTRNVAMLSVVTDEQARGRVRLDLDRLLREDARRLDDYQLCRPVIVGALR